MAKTDIDIKGTAFVDFKKVISIPKMTPKTPKFAQFSSKLTLERLYKLEYMIADGAMNEMKCKNFIKEFMHEKSNELYLFTIAHHMCIMDGLCDGYHWIFRDALAQSIDSNNLPSIKNNLDLYNYAKNHVDSHHGGVCFIYNYHFITEYDYILKNFKLQAHESDLPLVTNKNNESDTFHLLESIVKLKFDGEGSTTAYSDYHTNNKADKWGLVEEDE